MDRVLTSDHCMTYCVVNPRLERPLSPGDKLLVETVERDIPKYKSVDFGTLLPPGGDQANAV